MCKIIKIQKVKKNININIKIKMYKKTTMNKVKKKMSTFNCHKCSKTLKEHNQAVREYQLNVR